MGRTMEERLNAPDPEGWRPEAGDLLIGTVDEVSSREGDFGPYPLIIVEKSDGSYVAVHAFHSVLRNEIESLQPSIGDEIGIKYEGVKEPKGGLKKGMSGYEMYRVKLERKSPAGSTVPSPPRVQAVPEAERASADFLGDEPF